MTNQSVTNMNERFSTRKMVLTAMMSAVATIIYFLDFPVPLMPDFIKLDLSNAVSLLAGFSLGPVSGLLVCLMKNLIQLMIKGLGTTMGIGNLFDFVTSAVFVLTSSLIYQRKRTKKGAGISLIFGVLAFSLITLPLNYFVVYPVYFKYYGGEQAVLGAYRAIMPSVKNMFAALCIFNEPFTFIKGVLCAVIVMLIYKPLSPIIKGGIK